MIQARFSRVSLGVVLLGYFAIYLIITDAFTSGISSRNTDMLTIYCSMVYFSFVAYISYKAFASERSSNRIRLWLSLPVSRIRFNLFHALKVWFLSLLAAVFWIASCSCLLYKCDYSSVEHVSSLIIAMLVFNTITVILTLLLNSFLKSQSCLPISIALLWISNLMYISSKYSGKNAITDFINYVLPVGIALETVWFEFSSSQSFFSSSVPYMQLFIWIAIAFAVFYYRVAGEQV